MATNYYFLISALPSLRFGDPPPMSSEELLDFCAYHLSPRQAAMLGSIGLVPGETPANNAVAAQWHAWETAFRNQIVRVRTARTEQDPFGHLREDTDAFADLDAEAAEAFNSPNPLAQEQALDRRRWQRLEGLAAANPFSFELLVVYRLMLLLMEKWSQLEADKGREAIDRSVQSWTENIEISELMNARE